MKEKIDEFTKLHEKLLSSSPQEFPKTPAVSIGGKRQKKLSDIVPYHNEALLAQIKMQRKKLEIEILKENHENIVNREII